MAPGASEWIPYCGPAPVPADWLARWNLDPLVVVPLAVLALVSWRGRRDLRIARLGALGLAAFLYVSPFCALSSALFSARVVHHVLLATALAPLAARALRLDQRHTGASLALLTAFQALVFWGWHAPPLYAAALSNDALFWAMQASILATAAIWWAKLRQVPAGAAVIALLATMVLMGVLGALITFAGAPLYAPHWLTTQPWGFTALEDQQVAGLVMWVPASAAYLLAALTLLYRSLGASGRGAARA